MTMAPSRKHEVKYGSYTIPDVQQVKIELVDGDAEALRQGHANRGDRQGVRQYAITTLHGGSGILRGSEVAHGTRYRSNNGLVTHIEGGAFLPYRVQATAALHATDVSGHNAANLRVHQVSSTLGGSKRREYFFIGKKMYRTVSDSDHSLEDTGLTFTDNVYAAFEGMLNSTRYIVVCTGGTTNDVSVIADPTLSPPVASVAFALAGGDHVDAGWYTPNLGGGFNHFHGKIGGTTGYWHLNTTSALLTAPSPTVLTATADVPGSIANVTGASIDLALMGVNNSGASAESGHFGASGGSATCTPAAGVTTGSVYFGNGAFSASYPKGRRIVGIALTVAHIESAADANIYPLVVKVHIGGSSSISLSDGEELGTSGTKSYAGNSVTGGLDITTDDLDELIVELSYRELSTGSGTRLLTASDVDVVITYATDGAQATSPLGATCFGLDPLDQSAVYLRGPEYQDDATGVTVPRILWKGAMQYDSAATRPVITLSKPATNLRHVECGNFSGGGLVLFGDSVGGTGQVGKFIDTTGGRTPSDIGFKSVDQGYTEDWGVTDVVPCDRGCVFKAVKSDGLVMQDWLWNANNNSIHAFGPRETITSAPLRYARSDVGAELRRRYTFYATTTNTSVSRTFQPRNVFENPLNNNTSEVKANGPISVTLPDLDLLGAPERNKAILVAWYLGRDVSASSTVLLEYSTDGGSTWTTWTTFTAFGAKSALSTPVSFRYLMLRVSADHTADSANTPNCLGPILIEGFSGWRKLRKVTLLFNSNGDYFRAAYEGGTNQLFDLLRTQENTLPVQTFRDGAQTFFAEMPSGSLSRIPRALGESHERPYKLVKEGNSERREYLPVIDSLELLEVAS